MYWSRNRKIPHCVENNGPNFNLLMKIDALGSGVFRFLALCFFLYQKIDGLRLFLFLGRRRGRELFAYAIPDGRQLYPVYKQYAEDEKKRGIERAQPLYGKKDHAKMIAYIYRHNLADMGIFSVFRGKTFDMDTTVLTASDAAEYEEFKRSRREAEIAVTVRRLIVDASRRETDKRVLKTACERAKRIGASGLLVSPVNVAPARRLLAGSNVHIICLVGGTGESLPVLKKAEAKKARSQGAAEIRLVPAYSALAGGNLAYLKKEVKKVRKAVKKCAVTLSLEDGSLGGDDVALGVRAAREGGAHGVCVRGELSLVARAVEAGADKLRVDASNVENAGQLRAMLRAGALRATTVTPDRVVKELYDSLRPAPSKPVSAVPER